MSSPLKFIAALSLLVLAACGFTPMYGSGAGSSSGVSAPQGLDKVDIALIPDESGVYLRNLLIDSFYRGGYPSSPTHLLKIENLREREYSLDITRESEATRKQIRLTATLTLADRATGQPVLTRPLTAITSYNVLGSQFTTRVSENDAREAALADLARQIETQTALYFKR